MEDEETQGASVAVMDDAAAAEAAARAEARPDADESAVPPRRGRFGRGRAWVERPWPRARVVDVVSTVFALVVTTYVMMAVVHFNPINPSADLIFDDNTPTGGDMGAHVWGPAFLRDHLLPNFRLSGWSMDWYAGMPVYRFYMVTPALAIVALDTVLPYGVAFKLVSISGLVTLPLCCWAFGRLAGFRSPLPQLFAFAGMAFALQESYSIYGGNLKSTMAGEFSFSIALSLAMLGLGLLVRAMRTGQYRGLAAIVLALAVLSHGIVSLYVAMSALIIVLIHLDSVRRLKRGVLIGLGVVLLSAFWIGPFVGNHAFMTDMKYGFRPSGASDSFWDMFFPFPAPIDVAVTGLAVIGFVASVARRQLVGTALGVIALLTVAGVYLTRDSLPIIGLLWNPRLLPWLYLVEFLLMAIGFVEIGRHLAAVVTDRRPSVQPGWRTNVATFAAGALIVGLVFAFFFEVMPGGERITSHGQTVYAWGPFQKNAHPDDDDAYQKAQGPGWARYNFEGYEGRPVYPEYHDVVEAMGEIGASEGCGRALWENNKDNGEYGTTMALMLLPFWTDGCIGSMEGLFFEASGTTPYHFLTTAAMSESSSNPVRELRYENTDADVGVRHLQALGVRYVMVRTDEAKREAEGHDDLTLLRTVGPWDIYEVADADIVVPLDVQPVVVAPRPGDQRERNLELGTSWFQHPEEWAAVPADDGPADWQHLEVEPDTLRLIPDVDKCARQAAEAADTTTTAGAATTAPCEPDTRGKQVDIVIPTTPIEPVALPAIEVTDVEIGQDELSFRVDEVGVPVLVKVSYFPNWTADGADGPYRVAPNFMVVVPTSNEVTMHFARSRSDIVFYLMTLAGIALVIWMRVRGERPDDDGDRDEPVSPAPDGDEESVAPTADDDGAALADIRVREATVEVPAVVEPPPDLLPPSTDEPPAAR